MEPVPTVISVVEGEVSLTLSSESQISTAELVAKGISILHAINKPTLQETPISSSQKPADQVSWSEREAGAKAAGKISAKQLVFSDLPLPPLVTDLRARIFVVTRDHTGKLHQPALQFNTKQDLNQHIYSSPSTISGQAVWAAFPSLREVRAWQSGFDSQLLQWQNE